MAKLIFLGTPEYALPIPQSLKDAGHEILATVTQPPRPVGRKKVLTPSPVAVWSKENNIPNIDGEPEDIIGPLRELGAEVGVLAAYGRILPATLLETFPKGIVNIHPSLLPSWRGPAPIEGALVSGEKESGVTYIKLDEEMDHGPILKQLNTTIDPGENKESLLAKLFTIAAENLPEVLDDYLTNKTSLQEQDHSKATYTRLLKKEHGLLPLRYLKPALEGSKHEDDFPVPFMLTSYKPKNYFPLEPTAKNLDRLIRALSPWPGVWTEIEIKGETKRLKILESHTEDQNLVLDKVQLEGKTPVTGKQFRETYPGIL